MTDFNPTQITIQKIRDDERRKIAQDLRSLKRIYHTVIEDDTGYAYGVTAIWACIDVVEDGLDD